MGRTLRRRTPPTHPNQTKYAPSAPTTGGAHHWPQDATAGQLDQQQQDPGFLTYIASVLNKIRAQFTIRGPTSSTSFSNQGARGFLGCKSCMLTRFRGRLGRERICVCAFVPLFLSMACFILVCCIVWGCAATIGHHVV